MGGKHSKEDQLSGHFGGTKLRQEHELGHFSEMVHHTQDEGFVTGKRQASNTVSGDMGSWVTRDRKELKEPCQSLIE